MSLRLLPWSWSFDPPVLLGLVAAAFLYWWGVRYSLRAGMDRHLPSWRWVCYAAGLLAIFIALESPLDAWSDTYLWAHMVQHLVLIYLAAPLLLFGAPLMPVWRAVPLETRRTSLRWLMLHPRPRRAALALSRFISRPAIIWGLFVGDFIAWHTSVLYDAALDNQPIHDLEHLCFLVTALLFWAQIIPSLPLKPRLSLGAQAFYAFGAGAATELVSLALTFSAFPLYTHYATVSRPAGAISAIVDQTVAGALMNFTDVVLYGTLFMVLLWRWIEEALRQDADDEGPGFPSTRVSHHLG